MSDTKIRFLGELEGSLRAQAIVAELRARAVDAAEDADLVVVTPADLEELIEDATATAAFHATRDQDTLPSELVNRLIGGESPVKIWREHRGLSQRALAAQAGLNFTYLSQIETGARKGSTKTMRRLADALGLDIDDIV